AGDVPRDREEDQAGDEKRAPARDCQRARRKARRVRLAKLGRRASVHGARGRLLLRLALLRVALGLLRVALGLALRLARVALGLLLRARLGGFFLRFLAGLARLLAHRLLLLLGLGLGKGGKREAERGGNQHGNQTAH